MWWIILLSVIYRTNVLYVSEVWRINFIVSLTKLVVVYRSSSRNSLNVFCISGRLVTPYTNIEGGFGDFGAVVPVFASSFLQSVKAWNLLSRGMYGVVQSLLVLCFFPFHTLYSLPWDVLGTMCVLSSSSSLADVVLQGC